MRTTSVTPPHGPLAWLSQWRAAICMGAIVTVLFVGRFVGMPMFRVMDEAGSPEQSGTAVVVDRLAASGKYTTRWYLSFRVGDRIARVDTMDPEKWARTHEGDQVPVTYQIGRSGLLYVEDWQPVDHSRDRQKDRQ